MNVAVLATTLCWTFASGEEFAKIAWTAEYATKYTLDTAVAVAARENDSYAYIVGHAKGPRGSSTSFTGLLQPTETQLGPSRDYEDAFIAKISKRENGKLVWAYRLEEAGNTRFSAVAVSEDGSTVFAAGTVERNESKTVMAWRFDAATGKRKGTLAFSSIKGFHVVTDMHADEKSLYLCGRTDAGKESHANSPFSSRQGFLVAQTSHSGKVARTWNLGGGGDVVTEACSALSPSPDGAHLFAVGTGVAVAHSSTNGLLESAVVYKLSTRSGRASWARRIENTANHSVRASDVLARGGAVYVSASVAGGSALPRKAYVYKLSGGRGTLLWSRETCCGAAVAARQASAWAVRGIGARADGSVYHAALLEGSGDDGGGALVVAGVGAFGDGARAARTAAHFALADAVALCRGGALVVGTGARARDRTDDAPRGPRAVMVAWGGTARAEGGAARFYVRVAVWVRAAGVSVGAVADFVGERARARDAGATGARVVATVVGARADAVRADAVRRVARVFARGGAARNAVEQHFAWGGAPVRVDGGHVRVVEEGALWDGAPARKERAGARVAGGAAGGVGAAVAVGVAAAVVVARRRARARAGGRRR